VSSAVSEMASARGAARDSSAPHERRLSIKDVDARAYEAALSLELTHLDLARGGSGRRHG
jgi:hypothetical protein